MYGGTVVESGPTAELFEKRAHPYTQGLFAARPRLGLPRGTRLATIPGRVPELADLPVGCPFADRCPRVQDDCRAALPPEVSIAPGHGVRCLHLDEGFREAARALAAARAGPAGAFAGLGSGPHAAVSSASVSAAGTK